MMPDEAVSGGDSGTSEEVIRSAELGKVLYVEPSEVYLIEEEMNFLVYD